MKIGKTYTNGINRINIIACEDGVYTVRIFYPIRSKKNNFYTQAMTYSDLSSLISRKGMREVS